MAHRTYPPDEPGRAAVLASALVIVSVLLGCSDLVAPGTRPPRLSASPPAGTTLDSSAGPHPFRVDLELGDRGLQPGESIELLLFPYRGDFDWRGVQLNGDEASEGIEASPFSRFSPSVSEPGGSAGIRLVARQAVESGSRIAIDFAIDSLPAQRYGLDEAARLRLPVRFLDTDRRLREELDELEWPLQTEPAAHLRLVLPSQARVGEEVQLVAALVSAAFNPAWERRDTIALALPPGVSGPLRFPLRPRDSGARTIALRFDEPGVHRIEGRASADEGLDELRALSNPILVLPPDAPAEAIYWGDLHNHTRFSFDSRNRNLSGVTPAEEIALARQVARLDFIALTDHGQNGLEGGDWSRPTPTDMPPDDWRRYVDEVLDAEQSGIQVYVGYEHNDERGHTCMVFRGRGAYFVEAGRRLDHREVWNRHQQGELLSIPHLHPLRGLAAFGASSPHEMLVEIYSKWGPYEYYRNTPAYPREAGRSAEHLFEVHERAQRAPFARDLLAAGLRLGFVASSDHGPPGQYGLTAVRAPSNDRDAIFDALLERRTYATTGARMRIDFSVEGAAMGSVSRPATGDPAVRQRRIELAVHATQPIEQIAIIRNGETWFEENTGGGLEIARTLADDEALATTATQRPMTGEATAEYYLRVVQRDGHIGWSSPVYFVAP